MRLATTLCLAAVSVAKLTGSTTNAQEVNREAALEACVQQRAVFLTSHWVEYTVEQEFLAPSFADYVHVTGFENKPAKRWFGEQAIGPQGQWLSYTNLESPRKKQSVLKMSDGKMVFDIREGVLLQIHRGAGANSALTAPDEDLYREIVGLDSRRASIGTTLRGYGNEVPYSLVDMLEDKSFTLSPDLLETTRCVKIKKAGVADAWLDPSRGYCLLRMDRFVDGTPIARFKNTDFKEILPSIWLPQQSTIEYFDISGAPVAIAKLKTTELARNPPKNLFAINAKDFKGAMDWGRGGNVVNLAGFDGQDLETYLNEAPLDAVVSPSKNGWLRIVLAASTIFVVVVGSITAIRFMKARS